MFTFGREKEISHAVKFVGNAEKAKLLVAVITAVHDILEGKKSTEEVREIFINALIEGKSGVWESSGSWLIKLGHEYDELNLIWDELAVHPSAAVRFKVACHVFDLENKQANRIYDVLKNDNSKKVREHIIANWKYYKN